MKIILVLDAKSRRCIKLCATLEEEHYQAMPIHSLKNLKKHLQESICLAVVMDIDTVSIDNRLIKELATKNPGVYFIAISKDKYHPELKDAICHHIYACLKKPVDTDELLYWLRSIEENNVENS
jgi:DNA-binding NtrC family response regulator